MALSTGYRPDGAGGFDHSNLLSVIDAGGTLRYQQSGAGSSRDLIVERLMTLDR